MIRLDLWLALTIGEKLRAAELVFGDTDQQGRYASTLRYTPEYPADVRAFPLDPASQPLQSGEFSAALLELDTLLDAAQRPARPHQRSSEEFLAAGRCRRLSPVARVRSDAARAHICQEVEATVARFAEIAAGNNGPESGIHRFEQDIARRCRAFSPIPSPAYGGGEQQASLPRRSR